MRRPYIIHAPSFNGLIARNRNRASSAVFELQVARNIKVRNGHARASDLFAVDRESLPLPVHRSYSSAVDRRRRELRWGRTRRVRRAMPINKIERTRLVNHYTSLRDSHERY